MSITKERKTEVVTEYRRGEDDTGSPEVQIAVLTERINNLPGHVQTHHKDHAGRRGLLGMVSRRRRLLDYVKRMNPDSYRDLIERLGLRK
jgi:small subunit ribosomal protein S15